SLYRGDAIHGVARQELLRTILVRFSEAGIPVIVLKGAAMAALVYPSPALRPMRDIDLLVHRRDMERVEAVLHGLREEPANPKRLALVDIRQDVFSVRTGAAALRAAVRIPITEFWERARPAQIGSVATLVLSPEDLLLHVAFHLTVATGLVGQVRPLCDIAELCRRYAGTLQWSQLVARARSYNIAKPLYYA